MSFILLCIVLSGIFVIWDTASPVTDAVILCKDLNTIEELRTARVDALYKAAVVADQVGCCVNSSLQQRTFSHNVGQYPSVKASRYHGLVLISIIIFNLYFPLCLVHISLRSTLHAVSCVASCSCPIVSKGLQAGKSDV